jgi:hypothetical protein
MLATAVLLDGRERGIRIDVAGARAISQFFGCVGPVGVLVLLVGARLEVTSVATRAIGLQ